MKKLLLAAAVLFAAQGAQASSVEILSVRPMGQLTKTRDAIELTVTFSQPMVPLAASEDTSGFCPITVTPSVPGKCSWQGNNVLTFIPAEPLRPATRYDVSVPGGIASRVTGDTLLRGRAWSFTTLRPALVRSRPEHKSMWVLDGGEVFLQFNMDMDPVRARPGIVLSERRPGSWTDTPVPAGVRRATSEEIKKIWRWAYGIKPSTSNVLVLHPAKPIERNRLYQVRLTADLRAAAGNLGPAREKLLTFETYLPFEFLSPVTGTSFCLPNALSLRFSNPILYTDLLKHIRFEPEIRISTDIPSWRRAWTGSKNARQRYVGFDMYLALKPDTNYMLHVSPELKDAGGAPLGRTVSVPVRTQGYCPQFNMPTGNGVLEGYLPPLHPAEMINPGPISLRMYKVPDENIVSFFRGRATRKDPFTHGYHEVTKSWLPDIPRNVRMWHGIPLGEVLGKEKYGVVSLKAQFKNRWYHARLNVTRLGVTVKASPESTLAWVTYLRTGNPVIKADVEIRDNDNKLLWKGRSGRKGLVRAPGWKELGITDWGRWRTPRLWVIARQRGDVAVTATDWRGGISPWRFNISSDLNPRPYRYRGTLFTERGVYRSGETVHMKGLIRKLGKGDWILSDIREVVLTIRDPRGTEVHKATVPVSSFSSFDHSYAVPAGSPTGYWSIGVKGWRPEETRIGKGTIVQEVPRSRRRSRIGQPVIEVHQSFRVEPFKPASFEVRVNPLKDSLIAGADFEASVDGWYLFGAPMAEAPVEWKLRLEPASYTPPGPEDFGFGPPWWISDRTSSRLVASSKGTLDDKGKISVSSGLDTRGAKRAMRAVLEASATSPERQRLSGRGSAWVHPAGVYVGIKSKKRFVEKGSPIVSDMITVRPDGELQAGVALTARLTRRFWQSVRKAGLGGRLEWVTEKRDVVVATHTYTSAAGPVRFEYTPEKTGQFFLEVEAVDDAGRAASAGDSFYVTGEGESWWARQDTDIIELVADKKEYRPGQTARIMVKSPFRKSRALITVEREGVMQSWTTTLKGGADFVKVRLSDRHVPNVFVGVMLIQGRTSRKKFDDEGADLGKPQIKVGYAGLRVDPGGRRLSVEVETDKGEYRPGGKVKAKVTVRDGRKRGVRSEVALYVVDEGVLSLTGYSTPNPFDAFYGPRPLQVATADNRLYVIGQRNFGEKGKPRGGGGGGASLAGIDLRSRFVPTAFWKPSLITAKNGTAEVEFELPDNLSRFRVMAVAHEGKRFGSGESKFTVKKPLLLRPSLPRFARIGDTFKGGMVIHNYTASDASVRFKTNITGTGILCDGGGAEAEKLVPAGKAVEVLWDCRAGLIGKGVFEFRARTGSETDGLRWEVPVKVPVKLETVATLGTVGKPALEKIMPPEGAVPGVGGLDVGVSATAMSGLQEGARFLLRYPYGCLEQKMSRIFPVLVGADLTEAFGLGDLTGLKAAVREVLTELPQYQTGSGGFAYWPSRMRADPYLTSYALHAAAIAKREGYYVDQNVLDRAVRWLEGYVKGRKVDIAYPYSVEERLVSRAYGVYALTLHGSRQDAALNGLFQARDRIPLPGKAHLVRAAARLGARTQRDATAQDILNRVRTSPTTLYFDSSESDRMPWIHGSAVRTTALSLQALLEARDGFPGDEKAVRWLIEERKIKGRWRTTQENSLVLQAFQDFYRRYESAVPDFTARVAVGSEVWHEAFKGRDLTTRTKTFPMKALEGKTTRVTVDRAGTGRLYYTLRLRYAPGEGAPAKDSGFSVERKVEKLYGPGEGGTLGAGARAVVTLTVKTPKDRTFVALLNPIPAGFEIVDPSFGVESQEDARLLSERAKRGAHWGTFDRSEKYDDRIVIFADYLRAGEHTYSFLVQATVAGKFAAPPAFVEQMYQPEVFGRSPSGEATIE